MERNRYDVAIVGAGVMGAATAYALAQTRCRVVWFEQFDFGHDRGSSHGRSRTFRLSYREDSWVRMAMDAHELWRAAEAATGKELVVTLGGLDAGAGIDDNATALAACGATYELLDGEAAGRRWPLIALPSAAPVLFQPDAGIVLADVALGAFRDHAVSNGVELRVRSRVEHLEPAENEVKLTTADSSVSASAVIVTAGSWVRHLVEEIGISISVRPTRETVAFFEIDGTPPPLVEWGQPAAYALPGPGHGLKAGQHIAGPTSDPDEAQIVEEASVDILRGWVKERFPTARPDPIHTETCMYTNTSDESFIIERHGRVVVGSPCSGHGFKFAPLIGQRLSKLAEEVL